MKNKWTARILCIILCLGMMLSVLMPAFAAETEEEAEESGTTLSIHSTGEFLKFAENCRLDSYSENLTVYLKADIDLTGTGFTGIPIFCGTFRGDGHTISGIAITNGGSVQGLFRYLTETALVENLQVQGNVTPGGSKASIGGIAGENRGTITGCTFRGTVSGGDTVGGLVGLNTVIGIIENSNVYGTVYGNHFIGGIAGENEGVIRSCKNIAQVNTSAQQNTVDISDITMDSLTNSEATNTVTDIGGIAGVSSGVIRSCINRGDVGYPHMGYNIGGIAGTQSGYLGDCVNHGNIQGRKEVGGIAGQMEPVSFVEYTEDTLQILQNQLNGLSGSVYQVSNNAKSNANEIVSQLEDLKAQTETARDAVTSLFPGKDEEPSLPDPDSIQAAQNTLTSTINSMPTTLKNITSSLESTISSLNRDLQAVSNQINAMGATISNAEENLGGTITDISDLDTDELFFGKVSGCKNYSGVLGDHNVGGITGAIALYNNLDILENVDTSGETSLNYDSEVRAVVRDCENQGTVTCKAQNAGGIVGWQSLGLVKNCVNTGTVDAEAADHVGGIAGQSTGYLRENDAKCEIYSASHVGGIAGSGTIVTGSRSMVLIEGAAERVGAILGTAEERYISKAEIQEEAPIAGNYYACVTQDWGAIDGISYAGCAEPLDLDAFLELDGLNAMFKTVTIQFVYPDGKVNSVTQKPGGTLNESAIPPIPELEGYVGIWDGLEEADLTDILCNLTFEAVYTGHTTAVQSRDTRENGLPILLLQGEFSRNAAVSIAASEAAPQMEDGTVLESWTISCTEMASASAARLLMPEGLDAENTKLYLCSTEGEWIETEFTPDGSYLVFGLDGNDVTISLVEIPSDNSTLAIAAAAAAAGLILILIFRKKKKPAKQTEQT